jgi:hypothetical protein
MPVSTTTNAGTVQFREIACISRSVNRSPDLISSVNICFYGVWLT